MSQNDKLTLKQQAFVDAYLGEARGNGVKSAEIAGYKGEYQTLASIANENLNKPEIKAAISPRLEIAARKADKHIVNVYEEFKKNLEFVTKLRDAAAKWLIDPENPDKFTIDPRAEEIDVVYRDGVITRTATLAELLDKINGEYRHPTPFVKTVDLREYALKAIDRLDTCIDKFAKMGGEYTKERANPNDIQASIDRVMQAFLDKGIYPDAETARAAAEGYVQELGGEVN